MSAGCPANCDSVQIIEPRQDLLVDTAGANSDVDESGSVSLQAGQTAATVLFQVQKLSGDYHFEYLYVEAPGQLHPGAIQVITVAKATTGFTVFFAGTPIVDDSHILYWRVVIRRTTELLLIDAPEDLYLPMPRANTMAVAFHNPRSNVIYGFSELRVENLNDPPAVQAIIRVQVYQKTISGFLLAVNPTPPTNSYFLKVRTP